jgi:hypothetical protein
MLDQSFSLENLRAIYETENRRGKGVDKRFFPVLHAINQELTAKRTQLRAVRRANLGMSEDDLNVVTEPYLADLKNIRDRRETQLQLEMERVSQSIASRSFRLNLQRRDGPGNKSVYPANNSAEDYFVSKQLQRNISKLYKVKPASRREIVQQLRDALTGGFQLYLVKSDIKDFFETIPNSELIKKILDDQLLSNTSRHHIRSAIESYKVLSGNALGVPRGLGISSYLSELYMRSFDECVRAMDNIIYYARYVDDIVAVFAPEPGQVSSKYLDAIKTKISKAKLTPHPLKTQGYNINKSQTVRFDFLGYHFLVQSAACKLTISQSKVAKILARVDACITAFEADKAANHKIAFKMCVARMRFLTGNTRLTNNKGHVYTGIYYNNSGANDLTAMKNLDVSYIQKISSISSAKLSAALSHFSFERGFSERSFVRISSRKLAAITEAWS